MLAIDRSPWATNWPPKPIRLRATLAVDGLICLLKWRSEGNTNFDLLLIGVIRSNSAILWEVKGTVWLFFFFIRSAGIFQSFCSRSISSHLAPAASLGLTIVCNCHSIKQRVVIFILAMDNAAISSGSCSGFNVGKCRLTGFWNALLIPVRGFALINPTLTAYSIISFNRWHRRLTVSRLPFAAMGLIASMAFIAVTLWIGYLPKVGKICFSSERHVSWEWPSDTVLFLMVSHCAEMISRVLMLALSFVLTASSLCSWGSMLLRSNLFASSFLLRARASVTIG